MSATLVPHLSFPCHGSHPFKAQLTGEHLFSLLFCDTILVGCSTNNENRGNVLYLDNKVLFLVGQQELRDFIALIISKRGRLKALLERKKG